MNEKKPWYKSKIFLLAVTAVATIGTNLLTGFITGNGVTQDQIEAVAATQPAIATAIENTQNGGNILQSLSTLAFGLIGLWRLWFTKSVIG